VINRDHDYGFPEGPFSDERVVPLPCPAWNDPFARSDRPFPDYPTRLTNGNIRCRIPLMS